MLHPRGLALPFIGLLCGSLVTASCGAGSGEEATSTPTAALDAAAMAPGDAQPDADARLPRDAQGRARYAVTLVPEALTGLSGERDARFPAYQRPEAVALVRQIERDHGVEAILMYSHVGLGFAAWLTEADADALAADPRVEDVDFDRPQVLSAAWADSPAPPASGNTPEVAPWGKQAVNPSTAASTQAARVYLVDTGVGQHEDLNVVQRVNAPAPTETSLSNLVGCYSHATHVAGIVGAVVNGKGVKGVSPGAPIVSVTVYGTNDHGMGSGCLYGGIEGTDIVAALEWIYQDVASRGRMGVVNASMNTAYGYANDWASTGIIGKALKKVATPSGAYKGAFVVESAGNYYTDACGYAYDATSTNDGIMVVGALNAWGQPVVPLNGLPGFRNGDLAGSQAGSNFGRCVEAWMPGSQVYSSWGAWPQSSTTTYKSYAYLSGTSMAAPHLAGLAARLIETQGLGTPAAVESAVRAKLYAPGSKDKEGRAMSLATLSSSRPLAQPYAELAASASAFTPVPATSGAPNATLTGPVPNGSVTAKKDKPFDLSFDSWGAPSTGCDVKRVPRAGGPTTTLATGITYRDFGSLLWPVGTWDVRSTACPTAAAVMTVPSTALSAQFISQSMPTSVRPGQLISASVTMKNLGTTTWTQAGGFKLGSQGPQDSWTWGTNRVLLNAGESIAPGASKTFTFTAEAPPTTGSYTFQWQMVQENVAWFPEPSQALKVSVTGSASGCKAVNGQACP